MTTIDTTDKPTPEQIKANREAARDWYGYLADDNVEHVAQRIENLLGHGRRYTFAATNESMRFAMPEVRTGQQMKPRLRDGKSMLVYRLADTVPGMGDDTYRSAGISVADTYGSWGIHSEHATEAEAWADARDEKRVTRTTYVHIIGGRTPNNRDLGRSDRVEVVHFNGYGKRLQWVFAVEPDPRDER